MEQSDRGQEARESAVYPGLTDKHLGTALVAAYSNGVRNPHDPGPRAAPKRSRDGRLYVGMHI